MNHASKKIRRGTRQTGTISGIEDCGTIVIVWLRTDEGWSKPVFFDQRQFHHMLEAEGCGVESLLGREAVHDGTNLLLLEEI